jgi:predicted dehydrogenase
MSGEIGIGIVGAGAVGTAHARVYAADARAKLLGVCDLDGERAAALARECGAPFATSSLRQLLDLPGLTAVSIATPDFDHITPALAAAAAGKSMLCEKPLATGVPEAEAIVRAARVAGVSLMVDFPARFDPQLARVRNTIASGAIGQPQFIRLRLSDTVTVPTQVLSWAEEGSVVWFLGSYSVDAIRWLTGHEVERVYAVSRAQVLRQRGIDTSDFFHMTLEMDDGSVAAIESCWILAADAPDAGMLRAEVVGSDGHIELLPPCHGGVTVTLGTAEASDSLGHGSPTPTGSQLSVPAVRHFIDHLAEGTPLLVDGTDGLEATRVICAAEESARTGLPVRLRLC